VLKGGSGSVLWDFGSWSICGDFGLKVYEKIVMMFLVFIIEFFGLI